MKKTAKRWVMISVMIVILGALLGCPLFTGVPTILGARLTVDKDTGWFKETITFTFTLTSRVTFGSDGTYTEESLTWDTATSTLYVFEGDRGTYTYDPDTFILTITYQDDYDITSGTSGAWAPETWYPRVVTFPAYFTDQRYYGDGQVFVVNADNESMWTYTYSRSDADTDTADITSTITTTPEIGAAVTVNTDEDYTTGGVNTKTETRETGTIDNIFPDGTKFNKGDTATVQFRTDVSERDWDPVGGWTTAITYVNFYDMTFLNLKDVIISPTRYAARVLEE